MDSGTHYILLFSSVKCARPRAAVADYRKMDVSAQSCRWHVPCAKPINDGPAPRKYGKIPLG